MSVAKTCAPSACSRFRTAAPIPLAAPVTSALLPSSRIGRAVDVDRHAGHIGSVVRARRHDQRRGLGDGADPSHGDLLEWTFRSLIATELENFLQPSTGNDTWSNAVHPNAEASQLERELAREPHDARLGHRIGTTRAFRARRNPLAPRDRPAG